MTDTTSKISAVTVLTTPIMFTFQVHFNAPEHFMEALNKALSMLGITEETDVKFIVVVDFKSEDTEPQMKQADMVNNPKHYKLPGLDVEWIDVRSALLKTVPKNVPYEVVTAWSECITYLARMWGKNGIQDAEKAQFYLERMLKLSKPRS